MSKSIGQAAEEKYSLYSKQFDNLDDCTGEVLRGFCATCAQVDALNAQIEREGLLVENAKGNLVEHPAVNVKHKLEADKARAATYLRRALNENGSDGPSLMDDWS